MCHLQQAHDWNIQYTFWLHLMIAIHRGIYYSCKLYNSHNICILCNVQELLTIHFGWKKTYSLTECELSRIGLSVLQVTRPMYNNVWQRGDSLNAPIKKIIFRTNYVEKK